MDTAGKDVNGCTTKAVTDIGTAKVEDHPANGEEEGESNTLLPPRPGGMLRKSNKTQRKVQWNDTNGNKLVEVMEFDPSDVSDSDDEDSDSCICTIM